MIHKIKLFFSRIFKFKRSKNTHDDIAHDKRIDRLERNYLILLKRVLELDGVQFVTKTSSFTAKVIRTPHDEFNKGLNEPEPTIH